MKTAEEIIDYIETRIHDLEHEIFQQNKFLGWSSEANHALKDELTDLANWIESNEIPPK